MNPKITLLFFAALWMMGTTAANAAPTGGVVAGSHLSLLARNFFWDHRDHTFGNSKREWGQGLQAHFSSGYTPGPIGLGLDAHAYAALKLDSSRSRAGTQLLPLKTNGSARSESTSVGGAVKLRMG